MVALALLVLFVYIPAYSAGFIWDDDEYVTQNLTLRDGRGLARIWLEPGAVPQYYPLVHTMFWVEYHLWELQPAGYHAVNVLLHAVAVVLLYVIARRLALPGACFLAAIFGLHPVQVESVVWITERKNVLSAVLYLGSFLAWMRCCRFDRPAPLRVERGPYLVSMALFVGALLAKTVTASLPAVILLARWWKAGRIEKRMLTALAPFAVLGIALGSVTIFMEKHSVGAQGADWDLSAGERIAIAGRAVWFYLGKLVWPADLSFIYPRWEHGLTSWVAWIFPAAAVALLAILYTNRKRWGRGPLVSALYFGGTLVPALGFVNVYPMRYTFVADHYQYLACIGPIALATGSIGALVAKHPRLRLPASAFAAVVLIALAALSWNRAAALGEMESLWTDTIRKNPSAWMAHHNLGMLREEQGRGQEAIAAYRAALAVRNDLDQSHYNMGNVQARLGDWAAAESSYRAALAANPELDAARINLGNVMVRTGRLEEAIALYEAVLMRVDDASSRRNLYRALQRMGRDRDAAEQMKLFLLRSPGDLETMQRLAWLRATSPDLSARDGAEALLLARRLEESGGVPPAVLFDTMAAALAELGRFEEAILAIGRAIDAIGPDQPGPLEEMRRRLELYRSGAPYRSGVPLPR